MIYNQFMLFKNFIEFVFVVKNMPFVSGIVFFHKACGMSDGILFNDVLVQDAIVVFAATTYLLALQNFHGISSPCLAKVGHPRRSQGHAGVSKVGVRMWVWSKHQKGSNEVRLSSRFPLSRPV